MNNEMLQKMNQAVQFVKDSTRGIRSTNITPSFVDTFRIPYNGTEVLLKQIAFSSQAKGQIMVKCYDPSSVGTIQKALNGAGLKAYAFSKDTVAISVPPPSGEDREQIVQRLRKLGEEAKVSVRNVRKQFRTKIDKRLPEDTQNLLESEIQAETDKAIQQIDDWIESKIKGL